MDIIRGWLPKGDEIIMNLRPKGKPMEFVRFRTDGNGLVVVAPGKVQAATQSQSDRDTPSHGRLCQRALGK